MAETPVSESPEQPRFSPPPQRRVALLEVLGVFVGVTIACAVLWRWRWSLGLGIGTLSSHDLIPVIFLLLPTLIIWRRDEDFDAFGMTHQPLRRGLLLFAAACLVVFPPFILGFVIYYRLLCGRPLSELPRRYRLMCPRFVEGGAVARAVAILSSRSFGEFAVVQLGAVGLPEEYFFRGYVQSRLEHVWPAKRRLLGGQIGAALVVSSVLFALGHVLVDFNPWRLAVFFPSLLFGWLKGANRSIVASVLFHASCNLVSELLHRGYGLT